MEDRASPRTVDLCNLGPLVLLESRGGYRRSMCIFAAGEGWGVGGIHRFHQILKWSLGPLPTAEMTVSVHLDRPLFKG